MNNSFFRGGVPGSFILFKSIITAYRDGLISRQRFISEWEQAQKLLIKNEVGNV